jgi:hypothetical protein
VLAPRPPTWEPCCGSCRGVAQVGRVGGLSRRQESSLCSRNSVSHSLHLLITSLLLVLLTAQAYVLEQAHSAANAGP